MNDHRQIDARSLAMHRLVAAKVRRDPAQFEHARATLARWLDPRNPTRSEPYLREWARLMALGMEATLAAAEEESERAEALRACSPFAGILTPAERFTFLKAWSAAHATR
jgi:uncharacterized protein YmfQ (DUF2313 family)